MPRPPTPDPVEPALAAAPAVPRDPIDALPPARQRSVRRFREFCEQLIERPEHRQALIKKWDSLELPMPLVLFIYQHAVGKPPEIVEISGGPRPVILLPPGHAMRAALEAKLAQGLAKDDDGEADEDGELEVRL